ncbi:MFS transporter [Agromyces archimandritae]|uniref:MFS transporter n=1 Tax=Agromyces archimandritae TaxID=2781962 RepID=A0A975FMC7_9MICO|nr:MFS transporter [Agromyces archimandritae]QTX05100.1 MFS transporter [Agromyces archimandritae]
MSPVPAAPLWAGRTLALLGIILVACNLRSAVASLSPVLEMLERDIPLNATLVGALGMLPPLCYAVFGILTPLVTRRFGLEPVLIASLLALSIGLLGRGAAGDAVVLFGASALSFAAIGVGNVLLPPLVKRYFPDRVGLMTTVYATAMSLSTLVPPLVAVPVADAAGWRVSLGEWALLAVVSLVPWIVLAVRETSERRAAAAGAPAEPEAHAPGMADGAEPEELPEEPEPAGLRHALRSPVAWSLMVVFAVSGFTAYSGFAWMPQIVADIAGATPAEAGALLALFAGAGLPAGIIVPIVAARFGRVRLLIGIATACQLTGAAGLLAVPTTATWLWVFLLGSGPLLFPLSLVLINMRTRTHAGSVALSGFVQSIGYIIAAAGPMLTGGLHDLTGGWTGPLVMLGSACIASALAGLVISRPRYFEDDTGADAGGSLRSGRAGARALRRR